ncbi:DUF3240 family protein [Novosphingobium sp. KCTC 2891]|uniref:DUF3240 family protein n=1 Tax=Novosphingobium sp. KCTC 2891 TaxID=2989730 RepID=UPI0022228AFD|nr:DUF3240 family protein [Novosphingobium sp. KCTC 2891]MCW1382536.1 DUF3240 family protein [Novosphingobium sp. KCTC 2891]
MANLAYTFHCATADRDAICTALRAVVAVPIHRRDEDVLGRDFGDAGAAEQVSGSLRRTAIVLVADEEMRGALVAAVERARRRSPVRWIAVPVAHSGRIA